MVLWQLVYKNGRHFSHSTSDIIIIKVRSQSTSPGVVDIFA